MDIILLEDIRKLGKLGDKVTVKNGYARNFLMPLGKAVRANKENLAKFEERRSELEKIAKENLKAAQERAEKLSGMTVTIARMAGDEGKLFGSVGTGDIATAVTEASGVTVTKREVLMPDGLFRSVGEYDVELNLHTDVTATIKVAVIGEAA